MKDRLTVGLWTRVTGGFNHGRLQGAYLFVFLFSSLSAAAQDRGDLVVIGVLVFNTCYPCHLVGDAKIAKIGPISMINSAASPEAFQISSIRGL